MDFSSINQIKNRYDVNTMKQAIAARQRALKMAEMVQRIESGELALGARVEWFDNKGGDRTEYAGEIVGYSGFRVHVQLTSQDGGWASVDFDRVSAPYRTNSSYRAG